MKFSQILSVGLLGGALVFASGCQWWNSLFGMDAANNTGSGIPGATMQPLDDIDMGLDAPTAFGGAGAPPPSHANEWTTIPGLNLPTIYFAYNQERVGATERTKLEKVAEYMTQHADLGLIVEGHCDERGSSEYNMVLGERRAIAVKDYLISLGLPESRVRTQSFGEENPAVDGNFPSAYSQNRRAELIPARM